ncbi:MULTISPECIES: sensor histidine kinase [Pseudofrankia]|uniref:sensor histidine kinase n=1 Tax=Pseudofrankia TaxID=2994363 RepID=UPI000234B1E0|nr:MULTISPECIES: sensor histidine kinase [Pseudofrankia]OHV36560.1 two-component sensor histidine kinase [Pseudofrankia sp. EUN1h]
MTAEEAGPRRRRDHEGWSPVWARVRAAVLAPRDAREDGPRNRRALAFDLLVAVAATVAELSLLLDDGHTARVSTVLLAVGSGALLTARRRAPWLVLLATLALAGTLMATGDAPAGVPVLVALYSIGERDDWRLGLVAFVPTSVLLAVWSIVSVPVTAGALALGCYARTRRRYVRALEERARHLQRERDQLARIAAHEERASIARELHDIVAHSVTVMLLGVRGARDVLRTSPDRADDTLARVETSGEQSLTELRRMLTVLRAPGTPADSRPAPCLGDLDGLVAEYGAAGIPVELRVTGERRPLPGGLELSAYRIIEEALTNAVKHAHPSQVTVGLAYGDQGIDIEVVNDGTATEPMRAAAFGAAANAPVAVPENVPGNAPGNAPVTVGPAGHGLIGMRERAAVLGGELAFGPRPGGGFRVAVRLPETSTG